MPMSPQLPSNKPQAPISRPDPRTPLADPRVVVRFIDHVVRSGLGMTELRGVSLVAGAASLLVGIPLLTSAVEAFGAAVVAWLGIDGVAAGATLGASLIAVTGLLLAWTYFSAREDLRIARHHRLEDPAGHAHPRKAVVFSCSHAPPTAEQLRLLREAPHTDALQDLHALKGWVEILARALVFHGQTVERVTLLVSDSFSSEVAADLRLAVRDFVRRSTGREGLPVQVEIAVIHDANDAEEARVRTVEILAGYHARGVDPVEVAVHITGGTTAMSVGMTLAAAWRSAEVQYFPQHPSTEDGTRWGPLADVVGLLPVRISTETARLDLEDVVSSRA